MGPLSASAIWYAGAGDGRHSEVGLVGACHAILVARSRLLLLPRQRHVRRHVRNPATASQKAVPSPSCRSLAAPAIIVLFAAYCFLIVEAAQDVVLD